jgi:hypothetical protein
MVHPFLKVLLGFRRSGVLGAWWEKSEGVAVAGLHRFVDSLLSSFLLFWAFFLLSPQHFFVSNSCIVGVVAI